MAMFCGKCGAKREARDRFCIKCGNEFKGSHKEVSGKPMKAQQEQASKRKDEPAAPVTTGSRESARDRNLNWWRVIIVVGGLVVVIISVVIVFRLADKIYPRGEEQGTESQEVRNEGLSLVDKALEYAKAGEYQKGVDILRAAVKQEPGNGVYHWYLADLCMIVDDSASSLNAIEKCCEIYKDDLQWGPESLARREKIRVLDGAARMVEKGDFAGGIRLLRETAEKHPKEGVFPWYLSLLYEDKGDNKSALEEAENAYKLLQYDAIWAPKLRQRMLALRREDG